MSLFYFKYPAATLPTRLVFKSTKTLSLKECRKNFGPIKVFSLDDKNICTTNPKGKGVCFGDSGINANIFMFKMFKFRNFMQK